MLLLWLVLLLAPALAEEPLPSASPTAGTSEPLFCSDPVTTICEDPEKLSADYADLLKKFKKSVESNDQAAARTFLGTFKEIEKQSFIPLFDESRARLLDAVQSVGGLAPEARESFRKTINGVKFVSLSGAPEAVDRMREIIKKLPRSSILRQTTPDALDVVKNLKFERMTPLERELIQLILLTKVLKKAQMTECGESVPLNAFSLGAAWGIPSVAVCLDTTFKLQRLDVQTRYPILGMVFAHELGHHIDTGLYPELYQKYLSCLHEEAPDSKTSKRFRDRTAKEIVADFWSAIAIGNMIKTRAALLDEPPETERNRALRFVRGSLQWLCNMPSNADDEHPSWDFRIGKIFGQSPEIRRIMGCKPKPKCGLEGRR